jgi:hypothetical protein
MSCRRSDVYLARGGLGLPIFIPNQKARFQMSKRMRDEIETILRDVLKLPVVGHDPITGEAQYDITKMPPLDSFPNDVIADVIKANKELRNRRKRRGGGK